MKRWISFLCAVFMGLAFAYTVWPTPWRVYQQVDQRYLFRENRFNGQVQRLDKTRGWQDLGFDPERELQEARRAGYNEAKRQTGGLLTRWEQQRTARAEGYVEGYQAGLRNLPVPKPRNPLRDLLRASPR